MSGTECRTLKLEPAPGPTIDQVNLLLLKSECFRGECPTHLSRWMLKFCPNLALHEEAVKTTQLTSAHSPTHCTTVMHYYSTALLFYCTTGAFSVFSCRQIRHYLFWVTNDLRPNKSFKWTTSQIMKLNSIDKYLWHMWHDIHKMKHLNTRSQTGLSNIAGRTRSKCAKMWPTWYNIFSTKP